jgi:redox-sensitive bicupin YhaK (pirin superfamily)
MEIVSYIVDGELSHQDSNGNSETLGRGSIQYMSAGTGIYHSEMNKHENKPVRFIQIWIQPDRKGYKPNYGSKTYLPEERHNKLLHVISNKAASNEKLIG